MTKKVIIEKKSSLDRRVVEGIAVGVGIAVGLGLMNLLQFVISRL